MQYEPAYLSTDVDLSTWLLPTTALTRVRTHFDVDESDAISWIVQRVRDGRIFAGADNAKFSSGDYTRVWVKGPFWANWAYLAYEQRSFWKLGDITLYRDHGLLIGRFYGVRFDPQGFPEPNNPTPEPSAAAPPVARAEVVQAASNGRGGRNPKTYWEDAIIAMFDGLFHGTITPATQADLERAMLDWVLANRGESPSEASVRSRASKIWKVHNKEG